MRSERFSVNSLCRSSNATAEPPRAIHNEV
jgi:hypothetical protein